MKVKAEPLRSSLRLVGGPVRLESAAGSWRERHGLLVELEDAGGRIGRGEASPLPGYSQDTLAGCRAALAEVLADVAPLDEHGPIEPQLEVALARVDPALPAARFALETALLDLHGQRTGRPLARLLGGTATSVPLSALLQGSDGEALADEARALAAGGIRTFKLKIGPDLPRELDRVVSLRRALGPDAALRLDANRSLPPDRAGSFLAALAPFRPEFVEEPVAHACLPALAPSPVPIALDESLASPGAWPLVRPDLVRVVVLKPTVVGGLGRARELAARAAHLGARVVVTHCWEGPVALAAAAALALSLPSVAACGLAPHPALAAWPRCELPFIARGEIRPTGRPGLGLDLGW